MAYCFPFGEVVRPLAQQDRRPKQVFVLGVYASAVHAKRKRGPDVLPLAHPRQIGALGAHRERRHNAHRAWERSKTV